jgi:DNA end-binding protein Ku
MDGLEAEAFNVVRQALVNSRKASLGKISFSGRENIIAVVPATGDDQRMMAYTLRYRNELRDQSEYLRCIKQPPIAADSLKLAEMLISQMSAKLNISKFEDGYEVAVKALVEAEIKNMAIPVEQAPTQRASLMSSI